MVYRKNKDFRKAFGDAIENVAVRRQLRRCSLPSTRTVGLHPVNDYECVFEDDMTSSYSSQDELSSSDSDMPQTPPEQYTEDAQPMSSSLRRLSLSHPLFGLDYGLTAPSTSFHVDTLVLGSGPTGIGAAHRLAAARQGTWLMLDAFDRPGGMAITDIDEHGFNWDLGGHVIHSHFANFDQALAQHSDWVTPSRGGWVRVDSQWCPTPIQQHLGNLKQGQAICAELQQISRQPTSNLGEYYANTFGPQLNNLFFSPFNHKQWAFDLSQLDHSWTSLRSGSGSVNVPQACTVLAKAEKPSDTSSFPYPRLGTGSLWSSISESLPAENQRYNTQVVGLDLSNRRAILSTGESISFSHCISTIPLNKLLQMVSEQRPDLAAAGAQLKHSSTTAVGLGFEGELPEVLRGKTWVFNADPTVSFHRATVVTNFSAAMSDSQMSRPRWSVMFETSSSPLRPIDVSQESLVRDHLAELQRWGAITADQQPLSVYYKHLHMGYPLPFIGRDDLLAHKILPELEAYGVLSRGRFGGWRYESSNQDYAFMQGIEAVDAVLSGTPEKTYWPSRPTAVNLPQKTPLIVVRRQSLVKEAIFTPSIFDSPQPFQLAIPAVIAVA